MTTAGPLSGIRVLDVSTGYAAPITAMLLGDYGADVSKVEQPDGDPARTRVPLICAIETAVGVLAAARIAAVAGVERLSMGGVDLRRDLRAGGGMTPPSTSDHTWWSSPALPASHRPSTVSIHSSMTTPGCARRPATRMSSGSSASPPSTPGSCRSCTFFTPSKEDLSWARKVLAAFDAAGGAALRLPDGEFVDKPWRSGRSACSTLPSAQRRRRRAGRRPSSISLKRPRKGFA